MRPTAAPAIVTLLVCAPFLFLPAPAGAEVEAETCMYRNLPEPDSIRAVRVVARDRVGDERVTVVKMFGSRDAQGRRQMLVRFQEPVDVAGSAFLMLDREDGVKMYFRAGEQGPAKRISGTGRSMRMFGSDFSYEDFQYLQGFARPSESKRLEDATVGERSVYVVETRPSPERQSAYEAIVSFVDHETCVPLRLEMFEPGGRLRKVVSINPHQVLKRGPVWIAHRALIRDIRDYTTTQLLIDSTDQDALLPGDTFDVESFLGGPESP